MLCNLAGLMVRRSWCFDGFINPKKIEMRTGCGFCHSEFIDIIIKEIQVYTSGRHPSLPEDTDALFIVFKSHFGVGKAPSCANLGKSRVDLADDTQQRFSVGH